MKADLCLVKRASSDQAIICWDRLTGDIILYCVNWSVFMQDTGSRPESAAGVQLWVDKYSPRNFLQLLSDEQINLAVIKWLKSWDSTVFGHQLLTSKQQNAFPRASRLPKMAIENRILLIAGPPGKASITASHT